MFRGHQRFGSDSSRGGNSGRSRGGGAGHFNPNYISVAWTPPETKENEAKPEVKVAEKIKKILTPEEKQKEKERKQMLNMKKWRIIVRNLPFSITKEKFEEAFKKYGNVVETTLPTKNDPKGNTMLRGFGFVQFANFPDAHRAMKELNLKELCGRKIAVDWAAPKDEYLSATLKDKPLTSTEQTEVTTADSNDVEMKDARAKSIDKSEEKTEEKDSDNDSDNESENSNSDTPSSGDDDEVESESEEPKKKQRKRNLPDKGEEKQSKPDEGIQQGRTLFVRNLSFDTTGEDFKAFFEKFGTVKYALICKYPDTDHSRGTGFVQYEKPEMAEEVIEKAVRIEQLDKGLKLDGRWLSICKAMEKSEAKKIEHEKKEKEPKDKRNLNLMRIGFIRQGTEEANGMSEEDAAKRMKIAAAAKAKIKDLHIFVSPTRICVHNIPPTVNDKTLRQICLVSVNDDSARLKECRIMRDKDRQNSSGLGKSRGFAFVEFCEHSHALACVKNLNNNPNIFSNKKRPIVEFSLENLVALNRKKQRTEKGRQKQEELKQFVPASKESDGKSEKKRKQKLKKKGKKGTKTVSEPSTSAGDNADTAAADGEKRTFPLKTTQKLAETKKSLKEKGLKPLPTRLGPKIRHKRKNLASKELKPKKATNLTSKAVTAKVGIKRKSRKERRAEKSKK